MRKLLKVLRELKKHPMTKRVGGVYTRFFKWQLFFKYKGDMLIKWVDNASLIVRRGYTVSTGNYYFGLFEYEEMMFVLNYLDEKDVFVDVGANIGDYSIIAAGCCNASAIAFEPMPSVYDFMEEQIKVNKIESKVELHKMGISDKKGTLYFTDEDAVSHAVYEDDYAAKKIEVPVDTLDNVLSDRICNVIKVDVEGLEYFVLSGAKNLISNPNCNVIITECNGLSERYGVRKDALIDYLKKYEFYPYRYDPIENTCIRANEGDLNNVIFIKDLEKVNMRLNRSKRHTVYGKNF